MILQFVQNLALLVVLAVALRPLGEKLAGHRRTYGLATGLLFGAVGIIGMATPVTFAPGVIYDGRSVVLLVAGLFGGPLAAAVSATACAAYRLVLGGAGQVAGVAVILEAALVGALWHRLRRRDEAWVSPLGLFAAGLLAHVAMMVLQMLVPGMGTAILREVGPVVLVLFPLAFVLVAQVFLLAERSQRWQESLREREALQAAMVTCSPVALFGIDLDGNVQTWNESAERMLGWTAEEVLGHPLPIVPDAYRQEYRRFRDQLARGEGLQGVEVVRQRKDGSLFTGNLAAAPIRDARGEVVGIMGAIEDITDRKRAAEELEHGRDLMRYIIEHMRSAVAIHDRDLNYVYVSQRYRQEYDLEGVDIIGRHHYEVFPDLPQKWRDAHQRALAGEVVGEDLDRFVRPDGSEEWTRWECRPWYAPDGSIGGIVIYTEMITEAKQTEEALRRSEAAQRAVIEASPLAILSLSPSGHIRSWNPAAERMLGWSADEVLGCYLPDLGDEHEGNRGDESARLIARVAAGHAISQVETSRQRRDGSPLVVSLSAAPLRGPDGEVTGIMAILEDVTDRRQAAAERERLEAQLRQAQKMEAVGQLAGGVAHDFNNLLQVISGYGELAVADAEAGSPLRQSLDQMMKAAARAATLVQQLLAFSRRQVLEMQTVDLNHVIGEIARMLRRVIGEHIALEIVAGPDLGTVRADPGQVEQMLMNLCINARDAMPEGGSLTISTSNTRFDQEYCRVHTWARPGRYVQIAVADNGEGMDRATLARVFEPFFTTKSPGKGTGLGLATVYGLVKQHRGFIHAYSEPGRGTTFRIYLPEVDSPATAREDHGEPEPTGGTETVLVAEDDTMVRDLTRSILEGAGYTVLTAADGREAAQIFAAHADAIDLAILDVVMPELGGRAVHEHMLAIRPDVRVLFSSGYSLDAIHTNFELDPGLSLLQKPFSHQDLLRKVREALES